MATLSQLCYEFGPFRLDPVDGLLLRDDEVVPLTPKALEVLLALVERHGHLIGKDELMQKVWPDAFVEEANLSRHVFTLRQALGEEAGGLRYIETVPRRGYRFVASVREMRDEPDELIMEERSRSRVVIEQQQETSEAGFRAEIKPTALVQAPATKRWMKAGSIAVAVALVIGTAATFSFFSRAPVLTERDSVLLADFVNTTGDAVFDDTLKQALAVKLEESPFLQIFPDQQVRDTLRLMQRSPDERVTREVAREICQRQGIKALLAGTIAKLDRNYAMTLEAVNGQTGETIARQVVEAEGKDQVIKALGDVAAKLREKLGESLASIQKFDTPIEQATTSSLEALKAFSQGNQYQRQAKYFEAIQFHQRAIELDPNFALPYARMSSAYGNRSQQDEAIKAAEKAFELRERVSVREKFYISWLYHWNVTRDFDEQNRVAGLWKSAYPREAIPFTLRGINYALMGQHEKAIEEYREAIRLDPHSVQVPHNMATSFMVLNRFEEAKQPSKILPGPIVLYQIAFIEGDAAQMKRQIDVTISRGNEHFALHLQAQVAFFSGRLREAKEFNRRATDLAEHSNLQGHVDTYASWFSRQSASVGQCQRARETLSRISALPQNLYTFFNLGMALALCGEVKQAQSMIDERVRHYPKDRVAIEILVPLIQAAIEIQRGNRARAIQLLEDASRYKTATEFSAGFYQSYLLGQAHLGERKGAKATIEFQYILDHRGQSPISLLYPLAHLGLARAAALTGDTAQSRKAYQDFFALWKDADADLPILNEAEREYEKLK